MRAAQHALPRQTAAVLTEVTAIVDSSAGLAERAEALLAQVRRLVPFDAGWIALLGEDDVTHLALARSGYDDRVRGFLDSPALLDDVERAGLRRRPPPVRPRDLPFPPEELPGGADHLRPAGFRDGVSTGLFTEDGRCLGLLTLHTERPDSMSDGIRDALALLADPVAAGVDPMRSLATLADLVRRATAGAVLTPSGEVLALPGLPSSPLLAAGSAVLTAAAGELAEGGSYTSFLAPLDGAAGRGAAGRDTHVRITALAAPPTLRIVAAAVVLVSPPPDLLGLSRRELQVLGLLVTGASNEGIAAVLGIAPRTVEAHLDHARDKLGTPSRTAAAARALRLSLFVPAALTGRA